MPPILMTAKNAMTSSGHIGMNSATRSPRADAHAPQAVRAAMDVPPQLPIGQRPRFAFFAFPADSGLMLVGVPIHLSRQLWTMFMRPPTHHSVQAMPRDVSRMARYGS